MTVSSPGRPGSSDNRVLNRPEWLNQNPHHLDIVFFDLETTGGNPSNSSITEIAAIRYTNGKKVAQFSSLVNPHRRIPKIVENLTGISNDMVQSAPSIGDVYPSFAEFIGQSVVVSHGALGDINFLVHHHNEYLQQDFHNFFLCTHLLLEHHFDHLPSKSLSGVADFLGVKIPQSHRALADAQMTADVFWKLFTTLESKGFHTLEDLLKLQGDQRTLKKLGAGISPKKIQATAPQSPGVVYLLNGSREVCYLTASQNIKQTMMSLNKLGNDKEFNKLIADVSDFRAVRTSHFLDALRKENQELKKLLLPIDPRTVENRAYQYLQIFIPPDIQTECFGKVIQSSSLPQISKSAQKEEVPLEDIDGVPQEPVAAIRSAKTVLSLIKAKKSHSLVRQPKDFLHVGNLSVGYGFAFGPLTAEQTGFAQQLQRFLNENLLPLLTNQDLDPYRRLGMIFRVVAWLSGSSFETCLSHRFISSLNLLENYATVHKMFLKGSEWLEKPLQNFNLRSSFPLATPHGLIIISNTQTKELEYFGVAQGAIFEKGSLNYENAEKLKSKRFITRMFFKYQNNLEHYLFPHIFSHESCNQIDLFWSWKKNHNPEGHWLHFNDFKSLFDPAEAPQEMDF